MDNISSEQKDVLKPPPYSTPFNVDFFLSKSRGYFAEHIRRALSLPESIQGILIDYSTAEFIEDKLGQNFGFSPEQKAEFTRILRDILLTDIFWGDFPSLISSKLGVDANTANQIVKMLTDELLAPVIEDIKAMQRTKFADRIAQGKTSPAQQSSQETENTNQSNVINLRNK